MEHYTKGKNVELEVSVEGCLPGCVEGVEQLTVLPSTKLRDVIDSALQILKQVAQLIWVGCGPAAGKAVSGAEVIKRRIKGLHQLTRLTSKRVEEYWEPKLDGLDTLKVTREIPVVVILLSHLPLDASLPGYQAPGMLGEDFCKSEGRPRRQRKGRTGRDCVEDLNKSANESYYTKNRTCEYRHTEECLEEVGEEKRRPERRRREGRNVLMKSQNFNGNRGRGRGEGKGANGNDNSKDQKENEDWEAQGMGKGIGKEESNAWEENGNWIDTEGMNGGQGRRERGRGSDNSENKCYQGMNNGWGGRGGRGGRGRRNWDVCEDWRNYEGMNNEGHGRGQRRGRGKRERGTWDNEEKSKYGEETAGDFGRERGGGGRGRVRRGRGGSGNKRISEGMYEDRQENIMDFSRISDGGAEKI